MMNYTEQFRQHQKLQIAVLNQTPVNAYMPIQHLESKQLLFDLMQNAGSSSGIFVRRYIQRSTASLIHCLLYGFRVFDSEDPVLVTASELNDEFSDFIQVGKHIVDTFPVLNNLPEPLAPWKERARNHYNRKNDLRWDNFQRALSSKAWNISKQLKKTVEGERNSVNMPTNELSFELGTMIDAALDGTTDTMVWFLVACVTQDNYFITKAREELDEVIGRDRLPQASDKPNLPYITAIMEEVIRWRPVSPGGVPHLTSEETTYDGYTIPKKTIILANVWAITRDESVYGKDAAAFIPERWFEADGKTIKELPLPGFGYGRRLCPGRYFARSAMWVEIAQLIWAFDIKPGKNPETGEPVVIDDLSCTDGLVCRATDFNASFTPRGPWVRDIILKECDTHNADHEALLNVIGDELSHKL